MDHKSKNMIPLNIPTPGEPRRITQFPEVLTEAELIDFLRIREISSSKDPHNVIEHLKRMRGLPRLSICNKVLYPLEAVRQWIEKETTYGN